MNGIIGIVDYGVGNISSVRGALAAIGVSSNVVSQAEDIGMYDGCILPGVGSFVACMSALSQGGWDIALSNYAVELKKPLLGICLGMQVLADFGEEGAPAGECVHGLGLIPGKVTSLLSQSCNLRLPHVGWNEVSMCGKPDQVTEGIDQASDFYFVHSYAFTDIDPLYVLGTVTYGVEIPVLVRNGSVWGTQFHPEKSSKAGLKLLRNFTEVCRC